MVAFRFFLTKVFTIVGFPPGLPAFLFLLIAERFCAAVIRAAFAAGTHLGYLPLFALLLPHFSYPPPFFGRDMSTQFSLNHFVSPPRGFAITFSPCGTYRLASCILSLRRHLRKLKDIP